MGARRGRHGLAEPLSAVAVEKVLLGGAHGRSPLRDGKRDEETGRGNETGEWDGRKGQGKGPRERGSQRPNGRARQRLPRAPVDLSLRLSGPHVVPIDGACQSAAALSVAGRTMRP
ncbi:hypothetical protein SAV14893_041620 [Streptomyces avermitilis]|uniref:Uncharacterized protein n=1 Tax=Streptomyces avermitilis TaxID=33903 RepID=A0A4D4MSC6_STRAX|nr:hypothetical protein SAVMC3_53630 [Streptomyces avermitilis]GDY64769.1 hypothetical protein SAV14893_041620 [Streptomyces avermitilis]GDY75048.1 hypothetical protein SAV31267_045330 [Streptomyces avermitilis]GDY84067.1 hypothetical protein SAVCW2_32660 [Streptomyces avermitilis]